MSASGGIKRKLPPQATLRALLDYDADTGRFTWRERGDPWFDNRWVGHEAFPNFNCGYKVGTLCGKPSTLAHRVAYKYMTGEEPLGQVDHINGDRADNRWANLRLVDSTGNNRNRAISSNNTSGIMGVRYEWQRRKWTAYINLENRYTYLGRYATKEEAIEARRRAERENGFHENHGRKEGAPCL